MNTVDSKVYQLRECLVWLDLLRTVMQVAVRWVDVRNLPTQQL